MDITAAPTGELRLRAILETVIAEGDGAETGSLEAKSEINLGDKLGVAKVAKFILGMANRMPDAAARRFAGYAIMVLGAQNGSAPGLLPGVESHNLNASLARYFGPTTPRWDLYRLPVEDGREVLFVIVEPPQTGDPIYLCYQEFHSDDKRSRQHAMKDGAIYIRDYSSTREAKALEVRELMERSKTATTPDVDVHLTAGNAAVHLAGGRDLLDQWIDQNANDYRTERQKEAVERRANPRRSFPGLDPPTAFVHADTTPGPIEKVITKWEEKTRSNWLNTMHTLAGAVGEPVGFTVINSAKSFLSEPLMIVTIEGCYGVENEKFKDIDRYDVLPPVKPRSVTSLSMMVSPKLPHIRSIVAQREMKWKNTETGVEIKLAPEALRPETPWSPTSPNLVVVARDSDAEELRVTWSFTAKEINDRLSGEATLRVDRETGARALLVAYLSVAAAE